MRLLMFYTNNAVVRACSHLFPRGGDMNSDLTHTQVPEWPPEVELRILIGCGAAEGGV